MNEIIRFEIKETGEINALDFKRTDGACLFELFFKETAIILDCTKWQDIYLVDDEQFTEMKYWLKLYRLIEEDGLEVFTLVSLKNDDEQIKQQLCDQFDLRTCVQ